MSDETDKDVALVACAAKLSRGLFCPDALSFLWASLDPEDSVVVNVAECAAVEFGAMAPYVLGRWGMDTARHVLEAYGALKLAANVTGIPLPAHRPPIVPDAEYPLLAHVGAFVDGDLLATVQELWGGVRSPV